MYQKLYGYNANSLRMKDKTHRTHLDLGLELSETL